MGAFRWYNEKAYSIDETHLYESKSKQPQPKLEPCNHEEWYCINML